LTLSMESSRMDMRFAYSDLRENAAAILVRAGLPDEVARAVASGLVEADLLSHTTHGLALLADYVEELDRGAMEKSGGPLTVADHGAVSVWDARRLPGVWTTALAVAEAERRAGQFGLGAVAIRRSHHIACLASFLEAPARRGSLVLVFSSDPSGAHVAPFGGLTPVMTPNPIAAGIPTAADPILIDVSTSITTAAMCGRTIAAGGRLPGRWAMDKDGAATDDPSVIRAGGSILPIGGVDHGHKGYALGLLVEALTQGLGGYGRAEAPTQWGAAVLVLVFSPAQFSGGEAFARETGWLADVCRASRTPSGQSRVRLPGEAGLARKKDALARGVPLRAGVVESLAALAKRFSLDPPRSL
jgi:L-lactate dehydrogenase